ncbi:MAG: prepilin-type N-terminal cleavage/methylation domain-containing protein, partial [Planctomycetota bacterium]
MSVCVHVESAPRARHSQGFTLVELLVVVSIIALLIAILLPSLRKAREQAKLATCLANLTGLSKASLTYAAEDTDENMIPVPVWQVLYDAAGTIEWGGKAGQGQ